MATILQDAAYLGLRLIEGLLHLLPLRLCCAIGASGGLAFSWVAPSYRRLVINNLAIAFGDELDDAERRVLARRHFAALGRNFVSGLKVVTMTTEAVEQRVTYEGHEHLLDAAKGGRGVIGAIGHFGNWELFSQLPALFARPERATMFQSLTNPFINRHVVKSRSRNGLTLFDRADGIIGPLKYLRVGGGVGILFDQHAGDLGIWCPLFGRLASTTKLPALLAIKTKVPIVPMAVCSNGPGRWKIIFQPAIEPSDPVPEGGNRANHMTLRLNQALEAMVRVAPEEWFWVHDRWKTPQPDFLLAKKRRDIHTPGTSGSAEVLKPFRVLVRSPNPLGDACMAIPALRAMKNGTRPDLELTVLCRANLQGVWQGVGEVDHVLCIEADAKSKPRAVARLIRNSSRYDAALLLPNSLSSALECRLAGIPRIVGARGHQRSWLLNQIVPAETVRGPARHHAYFYLNIAGHCGADIAATDPFAANASAVEILDSDSTGKLAVGLCPGAEYGEAKRWPLPRYAEAVLEVSRRLTNDKPCEWRIFGSPNEAELAAKLAAEIAAVDPVNRAGKTSIAELGQELADCDVVLTNDTGTMHLAAALGVPTVAIFGSTEPAWTAPLGTIHRVIRRHVECSPCFLRECPRDYRCMNEIETSTVVEAIMETLSAKTAGKRS